MLSSSSLDGDFFLLVLITVLVMICSPRIDVTRIAAVRGFWLSAHGTGSMEICRCPYPGEERCIIIETQLKALNPPRIEPNAKSKGCQANKHRIYRNWCNSERSPLVDIKTSSIHYSMEKKAGNGSCGWYGERSNCDNNREGSCA